MLIGAHTGKLEVGISVESLADFPAPHGSKPVGIATGKPHHMAFPKLEHGAAAAATTLLKVKLEIHAAIKCTSRIAQTHRDVLRSALGSSRWRFNRNRLQK